MSNVHQATTSPWASANMLDKEAMEKIEYPNLEGVRVMIGSNFLLETTIKS